MTIAGVDFIVNRADLSDAAIVPATFPEPEELAEGECLLKVDTFAMTANNITYAVAREDLGYWTFFPHAREGFGRIPVWGFADVLASSVPGVSVGDRVYGYLPMSTHLLVRPGRVSDRSFFDMSEHRQERAPIYNQYAFTRSDPVYKPQDEAVISLFRPLFTTSFLIDDHLRDSDCFGAKSVVLYDEVEAMPSVDTVLVDMAGNADVLTRVHRHFGDALKSSTRVGGTHWSGGLHCNRPAARPQARVLFRPQPCAGPGQALGRRRLPGTRQRAVEQPRCPLARLADDQ